MDDLTETFVKDICQRFYTSVKCIQKEVLCSCVEILMLDLSHCGSNFLVWEVIYCVGDLMCFFASLTWTFFPCVNNCTVVETWYHKYSYVRKLLPCGNTFTVGGLSTVSFNFPVTLWPVIITVPWRRPGTISFIFTQYTIYLLGWNLLWGKSDTICFNFPVTLWLMIITVLWKRRSTLSFTFTQYTIYLLLSNFLWGKSDTVCFNFPVTHCLEGIRLLWGKFDTLNFLFPSKLFSYDIFPAKETTPSTSSLPINLCPVGISWPPGEIWHREFDLSLNLCPEGLT